MSVLEKLFPWTMMFGTRENFEGGYFAKEGELVAKYLKSGDKVLVCGSGNGREARPIIHQAKRIVCFDYGLGYLLAGKKLCDSEKVINVDFLLADALNLPFSRESFDFIFFSIFSPLKEHRFKVLEDIQKILKKTGVVLVTCYLPWAPKAIKYGFATCESLTQLGEQLHNCGFTLLDGGQDHIHKRYIFSIFSPQ